MIFFDNAIRLLAAALIASRIVYWIIEEYKLNNQKTPSITLSISSILKRLAISALHIFLIFQLFGLEIMSYQNAVSNTLLGISMIIMATGIGIFARRQLGDNWSHAAEYQIKRDHKLITTGIYAYIRHPIYLGLILTCLGVQLIVGSYLILLAMVVIPWICYFQSKKEETLLLRHFGKEYEAYQKRTYLFLPYLL